MEIKDFLLSWGMIIASAVMNVFANVFIKLESNRIGGLNFSGIGEAFSSFFRLAGSPLGALGVFLLFGGAGAWMVGLTKMELTSAMPASMTLNLLMAALAGILVFGEALSVYKIIGMALIPITLYLLSK